jgi:arylsulfatase A-like enzyme
VILILDALNPDYMSCYGYEQETTPFIDSLAAESVLFTKAYAQTSWTLPSIASLFTSTYPYVHQVWSLERRLSDNAYTLAETLKEKGFITCAITSNAQASSLYNLFQGFDNQIELFKKDRQMLRSQKRQGVVWAEDFIDPLQEWLSVHKSERFFLFIHLLQPHAPYNPPGEYVEEFSRGYRGWLHNRDILVHQGLDPQRVAPEDLDYIKARYCANIKYTDFYVSKIVSQLEEYGVLEKSILVMTSDHGEAFLEHGYFQHSNSVYEEEVRIPLMIRFPQKYGLGGQAVGELIQSIDLMPTFMDLYKQTAHKESLQGKSLLPLLAGSSQPIHPFVLAFMSPGSEMLRDKSYKLMREKGKYKLFDLGEDPQEQKNLLSERPITARYMLQELSKLKKRWVQRPDFTLNEDVSLDKKTIEQLRALGYIK